MRCEIQRASGREVTKDDVPGFDLELDIAENGTCRFFLEHETPVDCIAISRATGCKITSEWLDGITIEDEDNAKVEGR